MEATHKQVAFFYFCVPPKLSKGRFSTLIDMIVMMTADHPDFFTTKPPAGRQAT
jgi:hypothetical protein